MLTLGHLCAIAYRDCFANRCHRRSQRRQRGGLGQAPHAGARAWRLGQIAADKGFCAKVIASSRRKGGRRVTARCAPSAAGSRKSSKPGNAATASDACDGLAFAKPNSRSISRLSPPTLNAIGACKPPARFWQSPARFMTSAQAHRLTGAFESATIQPAFNIPSGAFGHFAP